MELAAMTQDKGERVLKSCPFCGGDATFEQLENTRWSVGCADIDGECMGFQSLQTFPRKADAAKAWNTRIAKTEPPAAEGEVTQAFARKLLADEWRKEGRDDLAKGIENGKDSEWSKSGPAVRAILAALASRTTETEAVTAGWIVGNGAGDKWRTMDSGGWEWTDQRDDAVRYARREDAEKVHAEDEDAWRVEPYARAALTPEKANG